jgi:hypothetical protein
MTTSSVGRVWSANCVADGTPCDRSDVLSIQTWPGSEALILDQNYSSPTALGAEPIRAFTMLLFL